MEFSATAKNPVCQEAAQRIRELIRQSGLQPGSKLPSERQLVERLGISRAPIREALRMLEIMGFIDVRPARGAFVVQPEGGLVLPVGEARADRAALVRDHLEARLLIEPGTAALAARHATPDAVSRLETMLKELEASLRRDDTLAAIVADTEFHRLIATSCGNRAVSFVLDALAGYLYQRLQNDPHTAREAGRRDAAARIGANHVGRSQREELAWFLFTGLKASLYLPNRWTRASREHGAILEGIAGRDPDAAAQAMRRHIGNALRDLPPQSGAVPPAGRSGRARPRKRSPY